MIGVDRAYARCEEITRAEARNFGYGIRLLPEPKRLAMSAVYALARRIDDVGDGDLPPDAKLAELADLRRRVDAVAAGEVPDRNDAVFVAVADAASRFAIPVGAFAEIVEGCEHDVRGVRYETMDDTVAYCRLVAGSVGRLSLGVFGTDAPDVTVPLADNLGVALQLTNILRDVVEDRSMGRVYLPATELDAVGVAPDLSGPPAAIEALVVRMGDHAVTWFARGLPLLDHLDRRSRACVAAMAGIYRRLLERIRRDPAAVLRGRMSLPATEKLIVAGRSLAGMTP